VSRNANKTYHRRMMITMTIYVMTVMLALPAARSAVDWPVKALLALAPVLPLIYVVWLMAQRVLHSDELEQRMHLIALGVAAAIVSVFSLVGGFLAAAKALPPETATILLVWVSPALMICYSAAQWWIGRRYGVQAFCEDDEAFPLYLRLLVAAALMACVGIWIYFKSADEFGVGLICGMAAGLAVGGGIAGIRRWRQSKRADR